MHQKSLKRGDEFFESKGIELTPQRKTRKPCLAEIVGPNTILAAGKGTGSPNSGDRMGKAVDDPTANEVYMVEVVGHDGLVHHLGPFQTRDDAQSWIAQNTQQPAGEMTAHPNRSLPKLSLV